MTLALHPIDRLHQENLQFLRSLPFRWRAWLNQTEEPSANHLLGRYGEQLVLDRLARLGYRARPTAYHCPHDLRIVAGSRGIELEVKTALPYYSPSMRCWRYQGRIHNRADIFVLICLFEIDQPYYFVIPHAALDRRRNVTVTSRDPRDYAGRWAPYLEAWPYLDEALKTAPPAYVQATLPVKQVASPLQNEAKR